MRASGLLLSTVRNTNVLKPEMIESFNVPKNKVARWAGITQAVFSSSQAVTAIFWGRASDRFGRKPVILTCMLCIMLTSLLFGLSRSLAWAIVARGLSGLVNGNIGVMRTAVAELVPQKELQPKAFSILPLVWTIGSIIGPGLGGALANPAAKYPQTFGNSRFFNQYPFALPNLVASLFFLVGLSAGFLFLKETLETKKHQRDYGRVLGKQLLRLVKSVNHTDSRDRAEQTASLLKDSRTSSNSVTHDGNTAPSNTGVVQPAPTGYREVSLLHYMCSYGVREHRIAFTPQYNFIPGLVTLARFSSRDSMTKYML